MAGKDCLLEGSTAWRKENCRLILRAWDSQSPFEQKVRNEAPLMYRSLLDLVKIMAGTYKNCSKCGPELWDYAREVRASLLGELVKAELAEAGIRGE